MKASMPPLPPPPTADTPRTLASGRAETPIAFVQAMVRAYAARGLNPEAMLQKAQITPEVLRQSGARITAGQFELASEAAMRELDDEALAGSSGACPGAATAC